MRNSGGPRFDGDRGSRARTSGAPSAAPSVVPLVTSSPSVGPPPTATSAGVFGAGLSACGLAVTFMGIFGSSGVAARLTGTLGVALMATGLALSILEVAQERRLREGDPFARVRATAPRGVRLRRVALVGAIAAAAAALPTWAALAPSSQGAGAGGASRLIAGCPERPIGVAERVVLTSTSGALDWTAGAHSGRGSSLVWPEVLASAAHPGVVDVWGRNGEQTDLCRLDVRP